MMMLLWEAPAKKRWHCPHVCVCVCLYVCVCVNLLKSIFSTDLKQRSEQNRNSITQVGWPWPEDLFKLWWHPQAIWPFFVWPAQIVVVVVMHRLCTLYQNLKSDRRLGHPGFTASDNNKKVLRAVSGHFDLDIKIFLKCGWNHQRIIHIKQRIQYGPIQIRREVIGNFDSQFQSFYRHQDCDVVPITEHFKFSPGAPWIHQ